jgi:hypothetical protein
MQGVICVAFVSTKNCDRMLSVCGQGRISTPENRVINVVGQTGKRYEISAAVKLISTVKVEIQEKGLFDQSWDRCLGRVWKFGEEVPGLELASTCPGAQLLWDDPQCRSSACRAISSTQNSRLQLQLRHRVHFKQCTAAVAAGLTRNGVPYPPPRQAQRVSPDKARLGR